MSSLQGSRAAGFHPTCFYNIIFTWVDRAGCAVHTRCVCCGRSHCWCSTRVGFVFTGAMGHSPSQAQAGAAENRDLECSVCVFTDGETCLSQWDGWDDKTGLSPQGLLQVSSHLCTPKVLQIWKGTVRIGKS